MKTSQPPVPSSSSTLGTTNIINNINNTINVINNINNPNSASKTNSPNDNPEGEPSIYLPAYSLKKSGGGGAGVGQPSRRNEEIDLTDENAKVAQERVENSSDTMY